MGFPVLLLIIITRLLRGNMLTCFYSTVVSVTYILEAINNPPVPTVPVPLRLQPNCIHPKYGNHIYPTVNNICIHCVDSGDSSLPLLLFIHGFPENFYSWRNQITYYQKKFRVVACDMRGFGDSDKPLSVEQYKREYLASDIKGVIDNLGYKKATLISHDWGGIIAFTFRELYPDYVNGLIGLSTTSWDAWMSGILNNATQSKESGYCYLYRHCSIPEMRLAHNNMSILDKFLIAPGKTTVTQDDVQCYKYWLSQPGALTSAINLYRANFNFAYSTKIFNDNVKSVIALGSNEVALDPDVIFPFMRNTYPNIVTAIIPNTGHFMPQQDPDIVNAFIDSWLPKIRS